MEVKKYNPFVVKTKPKTKAKPEPKTKLEARGLSNIIMSIIYLKGI